LELSMKRRTRWPNAVAVMRNVWWAMSSGEYCIILTDSCRYEPF
jgi:hypothetical protein